MRIILNDDATLRINSFKRYNYNIKPNITIYAQSTGEHRGKLIINNSSGIGIVTNYLTINGGDISVAGSTLGISVTNNLTINGGSVTVSGNTQAIGSINSITLGTGVTVKAGDDENSAVNVTSSFSGSHNQKWARIEKSSTVGVESVTLSPDSTTLVLNGDATGLTAEINPVNASNKSVKWTVSEGSDKVKLCSDSECSNEIGTNSTTDLTVYAKGISTGEATITVTTEDGGFSDTCTVMVFVPVESVKLTPSTSSPNIGDVVTLTAEVAPDNVTDKTVIWSVSDTSKVMLYTDPECSSGNEVGAEATPTLVVYAKVLSEGETIVTVVSSYDNEKSASSVFTSTYGPVSFMDWDETQKQLVPNQKSRSEYELITDNTTTFEDGRWYVVNSDVTIDERITVNGTAYLILADGATLTANKGITVEDDNALHIYGQSAQTGVLNATGTDYETDIYGTQIKVGSDA